MPCGAGCIMCSLGFLPRVLRDPSMLESGPQGPLELEGQTVGPWLPFVTCLRVGEDCRVLGWLGSSVWGLQI